MNILITDSNFKHTLGIVRQLGKEGFNVYVLSFKKYSLSYFSKFCNKELIVNKNFSLKDIINLCEEFNINLIIPVGTNSFKKFVPWMSELIEHNIFMVTVDEEKLNLAFSKKETYKFADKLGIPVPKTFYPKKIKEIEYLNINFPCVIKGLYEVGGNIVDYANNKKNLINKYYTMCKKYNFSEENNNLPMIQEYIEGYGCGFFAVYNNGKCALTFQHKRIREWPVKGGASVCAESYKNNLLEKYGKRILDKLQWHGIAMVEFKMTKEGIPVLMEINPKFWGSLDLALEAGVNFPKALIDIYLGKDVNYSNNYKIPLKYHWPLNGDLLHGINNPKNLFKVIIDCINPKVKSNIWITDFRPTLKMLFDFLKELFKFALFKLRKR